MSQYIIEKLKKYIMHCRQLRDFIGCSVADLQFMKGGGTIIYAVDFSEIYSYLNPNNVVEEFSFVANYSTLDAKLIQRLVLHHFFYASPNKHILLNPYAIELEGFVAQGKEGAYVNMAREALRVYKEIETLPQNARFLSISQKIKRKKNLVKRDFDDIYEFLKSSAPSLLNILNPPWKEPLVLLKELFERQTFQNLTDIGISRAEISSDEEVEDRWLQTLVAFRGEQSISSSIIDANAAGILIRVNQLLKDRNIRVLLVTRSKYMHETMRSDLEHYGSYYNNIGNFLRHPISFYFHSGINNNKSLDDLILELEKEQKIMDFFLGLIDNDSNSNNIQSDDFYSEINKHLSEITSTWKSAGVIEATYGFKVGDIDKSRRKELDKSILVFFEYLHKSAEIRSFLTDKLTELYDQLRRQHQDLGVYTEAETSNLLQLNIGLESYPDKYVLGTNRQAVPYTFQFYSNDAAALFEKLGNKHYSIEDVLPLIIDGFSQETDYERLLAMAFILGTLGKWREAEKYCQEALDNKYLIKGVYPHEGYFLLAICMRKHNPSIERQKLALEFLEKALEEKRKWKKNKSYQDPRYLHEKGVQILKVRLDYNIAEDIQMPSEQEGFQYIKEALDLSESDRYLQIQALNNILYYYIRTGVVDDKGEINITLNELTSKQSKIEQNIKNWPGVILDTVALALWQIDSLKSQSVIAKINEYFNLAISNKLLERSERLLIEKNYQNFLSALEKQDYDINQLKRNV